jgi:3-deoxy-7-phosphoheptulonate synthase
MGFKNSMDGNVDQAIHAVTAARSSHTFFHTNEKGKLEVTQSQGNEDTHIVLRGSLSDPNYDPLSVQGALQKLRQRSLNPILLIDCSHGNCQKDAERQKDALYSILEQIEEGTEEIVGVMLESHLKAGNQFLSESPSSLKYGVSITDPCIDWGTTESLVKSVARSCLSSRVIRLDPQTQHR